MDEDNVLLWGGFLALLAIAVIGGGAQLLGGGAPVLQEGGAPVGQGVEDRAAPSLPLMAGTALCRIAQPARALPAAIHESSGVAASRRRDGVFWTHNDSGDPVLYAVGPGGELAGRTVVQGAEVRDWEDLALGPCPDGECLYIGDIGDNAAERPFVTVYRVREPAPGEGQTGPAEALHARYPDGPHDAEALFVLPSGEIYVLTKGETGPAALYRFPPDARPGRTAQLERVRELTRSAVAREERITGAGASPDGRWIAVRTLGSLTLHPARDFLGTGEDRGTRVDLSGLREAQGEAVGFATGDSLVLTSEGGKAADPATFGRLACDFQ